MRHPGLASQSEMSIRDSYRMGNRLQIRGEGMKPKKMLITMIDSYLCFLLLSFLLTMLLVPHVLQHYLHGISSDPTWQDA